MNEDYLSNTDIYNWMNYKFANPIYPHLPNMVAAYIIDNKDKLDLYLNPNVKANKVIEYIAKRFKETRQNNILDYVREFVEGKDD